MPRHRWEDKINVHVKDIGCDGMDHIHLSQDGVQLEEPANTVMNFWVPQKAGNLDQLTISLSKLTLLHIVH
jgi:hypothetical protein